MLVLVLVESKLLIDRFPVLTKLPEFVVVIESFNRGFIVNGLQLLVLFGHVTVYERLNLST